MPVNASDLLKIARKQVYHFTSDTSYDENSYEPYYARKANGNLDDKDPAGITKVAPVDTDEYGRGQNWTKYARDLDSINETEYIPWGSTPPDRLYYKNGYAWCGSFVIWCFYQAEIEYQKATNPGGTFSKPLAIREAMTKLRLIDANNNFFRGAAGIPGWKNHMVTWHSDVLKKRSDTDFQTDVQTGDIVFMSFSDTTSAEHVAIVESYTPGDDEVYLIEGNMSNAYEDVISGRTVSSRGTSNHNHYRRYFSNTVVKNGVITYIYRPNWGHDADTAYPPAGAKLNHKANADGKYVLSWSKESSRIINKVELVRNNVTRTVEDGLSVTSIAFPYTNSRGETYTLQANDKLIIHARYSTEQSYRPEASVTINVMKYAAPTELFFNWNNTTLYWFRNIYATKYRVIKNNGTPTSDIYNAFYNDTSVKTGDTFKVFIPGDEIAFQSDNSTVYTVQPPPEAPTIVDNFEKQKILLYEEDETIFESLGICDLGDAKSCTVYEERNGEYYMEMEYLASNPKAEELKLRRIIFCKSNPFDDPEPFRIYSIKKTNKKVITIKAYHISYDLCGWIFIPSFSNLTYDELLARMNNAEYGTNILIEDAVSSDKSKYNFRFVCSYSQAAKEAKLDKYQFSSAAVDNVRSLLCGDNGVVKAYGGELLFKRWTVYHMEQRGTDAAYTIRYGKNIKSMESTSAVDQSYSAIFPYMIKDSNNDTGESVPPSIWTLPSGSKVIPIHPTIPPSIDFSRILPYDIKDADLNQTTEVGEDGMPTEEGVRRVVQEYINENHLESKLLEGTCDFTIELENSLWNGNIQRNCPGIETARLCDDVSVYYPELGITAKKKITKTEYDAIRNIYKKIEITDGTEDSNKIGSILSNNFTSGGNSSTVTYSDVVELIKKNQGSTMMKGYYKADVNNFYADQQYTTVLDKKEGVIYLDIPTGFMYTYIQGQTGYRSTTNTSSIDVIFNQNDFDWNDGTRNVSIKDSKWALKSWANDLFAVSSAFDNSPDFDFDSGESGWYIINDSKWATHSWVTGTATIPWAHISGAPSIPTLNDFVIQSWNALSTKAPSGVAINAHLNTLLGGYYTIAQTDSAISAATTAIQTWVNNRAVRYDTNAQGLNDIQKGYARTNIGALSADALNDYYNKDDVNEMFSGVVYESDLAAYMPKSGGTFTGAISVSDGLYVNGRYYGSGDDEGIVVGPASNNYAGITLGYHNGERVVLYNRLSDHTAFLRHNNGSATYDLTFPAKNGIIATTADIASSMPTLDDFVTSEWRALSVKAPNCMVVNSAINGAIDSLLTTRGAVSFIASNPYITFDDTNYTGVWNLQSNNNRFGIGYNNGAGAWLRSVQIDAAGNVYANGNYTGGDGDMLATHNWVIANFQPKTCLIEGTMILMADGSEKPIEEIKMGDEIMSYDITNDCLTEAVVLDSRFTGTTHMYTALITEDGHYIEYHGTHSIYDDDLKHLKSCDGFPVGDNILESNGSRSPMIARETIDKHCDKKHYVIISSNDLYFANGMLLGHWAETRREYLSENDGSKLLSMPDELIEMINRHGDLLVLKNVDLNEEVLPELISALKVEYRAKRAMDEQKAILDQTDYKLLKSSEQFIRAFKTAKTTDDVLAIPDSLLIEDTELVRRVDARAEYNRLEAEYNEAHARAAAVRKRHRNENLLSRDEAERLINAESNSALAMFKAWAQSK